MNLHAVPVCSRLIAVLVVAAAVVAGCAAARLASGWAPTAVAANGSPDDWGDKRICSTMKDGLQLSVANDAERVYVLAKFRANDPKWSSAASRGGLSLRVVGPGKRTMSFRLPQGPKRSMGERPVGSPDSTLEARPWRMNPMGPEFEGKLVVTDIDKNVIPMEPDGSQVLPPKAKVIRDGQMREIEARTLVPGDVMVVEEGDLISADSRLVYSADLRVDNSALTGEVDPVVRRADVVCIDPPSITDVESFIFTGSTAVLGQGRAVVYATGMTTEFGKIAGLTQSVGDRLSPLQKNIARLSQLISIIAVVLGIFFFAIGKIVVGMETLEAVVFAIGIIVANVPEGLLPTLTMALSVAAQRMAKRNVLVKKLSSVETLGSTTVICTDKTGTLTANQMTVREVWLPGASVEVDGVGYAPRARSRSRASRRHRRRQDAARRLPRRRRALQQRAPSRARRGDATSGRSSATRPRPRCSSPPRRPASTSRSSRTNARVASSTRSTRRASA